MSDQAKQQKTYVPFKHYADKRGVSVRTLDRWVEAGIIDPPEKINNRKYLPEDTEPRRDSEKAA